jgi:hypothetical protein
MHRERKTGRGWPMCVSRSTMIATMKFVHWLRYWYYAYWSQPEHERQIFRALKNGSCRSLVEIGVQDGRCAERILRWLKDCGTTVRYTGIDLFEARPAAPLSYSVKEVYRRLARWTPHLRLVPGDPLTALRRTANDLRETDVLIIHADQDESSLAHAWPYVPRMLTSQSIILREVPVEGARQRLTFARLTLGDVEHLAAASRSGARRAA